ncbi:MAG: fatty acid desaturase family protein [Methylococcaceae bacterium]
MNPSAEEAYLRTDRSALFAELTDLLKPYSCYEKQPGYYMRRFAWYVVVHIAMMLAVAQTNNPALCILFLSIDAVYILRMGFIGHDLAHGATANTRFYKDWLGEFVWSFFLGLSKEFWDKKHTLHHRYTNISSDEHSDPDIETPPFILGETQVKPYTHRLAWCIAKTQHVVYWMALSLLVIGLSMESLIFVLTGQFKGRSFAIDSNKYVVIGLIVSGYILNNLALFMAKPLWLGLVLLLYKYLIAGFCIGLVFALNHVGLPTLDGAYPVDRLTLQTYTTRNINGRFGRWFWGVLAYQTEHHLWPAISWHKLPEAAAVTRAFCEQHNIIYNEVGPVQAFTDSCRVLKHLSRKAVFTTGE